MKCFGITDRGKLRRTNQDSYVIANNEAGDLLAIVCDGIGGGRGGDVASRMAVSHFSIAFSANEGFSDEAGVRRWLKREIAGANHEIYTAGKKREELRGMGTTFCAVLICSVGRFVINIGDSRAYSYDKQNHSLMQLTRDHTLVEDMVEHGELTREEARTYPKRNVLTNALGVWDNVHQDIVRHDEPLTGFLICSDGLHGYVSREEIADIVMNEDTDPALRVRKLLNAALDAGGYDNITAVLIDLEGEEK